MKTQKEITSFEDLLEYKYGKKGDSARDKFDEESKAFMIGELIKAERIRANMTQEELAKKTGTQKSYISRIERGKSDIQLSTLFKLIEEGLGKKLNLIIG
jgi:DNA-binding XRE family transcriptional regulator